MAYTSQEVEEYLPNVSPSVMTGIYNMHTRDRRTNEFIGRRTEGKTD